MTSGERTRPDLSVLRMDPEELGERRRFGWLGWAVVALLLAAAAAAVWLYVPLPFLLPQVEATSVRQVSPQQAQTVLTATGYTVARRRAAVGAKVIGRIVDLPVDEGDRVARGDLIAVLDSDDVAADVAAAEAALNERLAERVDAERELGRRQRLVAEGVFAQAELDAAQTRLDVVEAQIASAEARLAAGRAQLTYTRIVAPIEGVVIERNVEVGEMVAPGGFTSQQSTGSIVRLADPESLEVEADVNESFIARLRRGQPATIEVDAVPDHRYRGRLRQIVPTADRQRAVVEVKVSIEDRDERLVPDMSCTVTFLDEEAETVEALPTRLYVPANAVVRRDGATFVFRLEEDIVRLTAVELGEESAEGVEILGGVGAGERLAIPQDATLEDGATVRVAP
ncbi:MAG: efflux RND transporter periplasmic adaptor subunit [Acidobacteriota bacterium]